MVDFTQPLGAMHRAEASVQRSAERIAGIGLTPQGDSVDLSAEMVSLALARNDFTVSTKVTQSQNQMARSLLNLLV
jgi:hypothetical protein